MRLVVHVVAALGFFLSAAAPSYAATCCGFGPTKLRFETVTGSGTSLEANCMSRPATSRW